jgi:hypothetical protein
MVGRFGVGIIAALAAAFSLNRLMESLLFGVKPTVAAVIVTITSVAAIDVWAARVARVATGPKCRAQGRMGVNNRLLSEHPEDDATESRRGHAAVATYAQNEHRLM